MTLTALVTGAAGFTGQYVVAALRDRGYRVIGLGIGDRGQSEEWISCDLRNEAAALAGLRGINPTLVVHLAAVSFVGHGNNLDFYETNVVGTFNLLQAIAAGQTPRKILIASSANVYGRAASEATTEDTCPSPVNHYAASKLAMECLVRNLFEELPIIITRPFNYTGPGQDERFVVPKIVAHFCRRSSTIELGHITPERDFSDVADVVEAYVRLLHSEVRSEIINVCSGRAISISQVVEYLNELAGYRIEVRTDPALLRTAEIQRLAGSNEKLTNLTGFSPQRSFLNTLKRMYSHCSSENMSIS